jgi:hypothetical protein
LLGARTGRQKWRISITKLQDSSASCLPLRHQLPCRRSLCVSCVNRGNERRRL